MCVICCCFLFCLLWVCVCVLFVCLKLQSTQWITGCNQNPYVQTKFAMLDCGGAWKKTWKCVFCRLNESAEHNLNFLFRQKACIQSACLFLIWRIVDTGWNQAFSNMCVNCFIEQQNKSAQMWNKKFFFFLKPVLKDRAIDATIFQNPQKLHMTIGTLVLLSNSEIQQARDLLFQCYDDLVEWVWYFCIQTWT